MIKKVVIIVGFFIAFSTHAQLKKITLEESVLQQGRKFGADRLTGFQWIPNTTNYVYYTDTWTKMVTASVVDKNTKELVSLAEINNALGTKLRNFFGLEWMDATTILVNDGGKLYRYSISSKSGNLVQETSETQENQTLDTKKELLAFTEGNNLFLLNKKSEKITVTNNSDKNIVSGQAVSRSEFGITGGIFWSPQSSYLAFYQKDETEVADYPLLDVTETPGKLG